MASKFRLVKDRTRTNTEAKFQLVAARDFTTVTGKRIRRGDKGGHVDSVFCLSHRGSCWIDVGACVVGAVVENDAYLGGNVTATKNARISDEAVVLGLATARAAIHLIGCRVHDKACIQGHDIEISGKSRIFSDGVVKGSHITLRTEVYCEGHILSGASMNGDIYVEKDATVGDVSISGDYLFGDGATIERNEDILYFGHVGSECDSLTAYRIGDRGIGIARGCFRGTLHEFREAVEKRHGGVEGNPRFHKSYMGIANIIAHWFGREDLII